MDYRQLANTVFMKLFKLIVMSISNTLGDKIAYHKQRSHRIEGLSDAVFAIAMTLLVLDIRTPLKEMETGPVVFHSLIDTSPKILTFILSFSVAGQFWSVFTNQFNHLHTSDRNEFIIALFFLMFVSLLPFSTSFLSEHLWSRVATGFYIFNQILILVFNTLHWFYCYHFGLMKLEANQSIAIHKAIMTRTRIVFGAYAILIGCCFFSSYLALYGFILVHFIFTFSGFIDMLHSKRMKKIKSTRRKLKEGISVGNDQLSNSPAQLIK
jgi:uncharacterized membrane protein